MWVLRQNERIQYLYEMITNWCVFDCRHSDTVSLELTYHHAPVKVLPLTLIGLNLNCGRRDILVTTLSTDESSCQHRVACDFIEEIIISGLSHCSYDCWCNNTNPCEIYIGIRNGEDKDLCDVFRSSSLMINVP